MFADSALYFLELLDSEDVSDVLDVCCDNPLSKINADLYQASFYLYARLSQSLKGLSYAEFESLNAFELRMLLQGVLRAANEDKREQDRIMKKR